MKLERKSFFIFLAVLVTAACNPARRLNNNQYLLNKNKIKIDNSSVNKDDLKALFKQKPNRKILGLFRFHLWLYNLVDKEKTEKKKAAWVQKTEKENELRRAKGKKEIRIDKLIFREKLLNIGEEPAILDSTLTERTKKQFQLYLFRKGFFHAMVTDTTSYKKNHQANVTYNLHCNQPYLIQNISYSSRDSVLNRLLSAEQTNSLLLSGSRYDEDMLEKERERLNFEIRNRGYYFFNKNYITYDPDSSLNAHAVDIYLYLNLVNENVDQSLNLNLTTEDHHTFQLNNIYIQTDYNLKEPNAIPKDTSFLNDYYFLFSGQEQFRKEAVLRAIFMKRGDLFKQSDLDYTYTRLLDLSVFKFIKVLFTEVPRDSSQKNYLLNVNIQLTPVPKQDYTIETEATHAGGNLGLAGSFGYRNKNTFKGAELFEFKIKGAVEALRNFNDSLTSKRLFFFNTYEIGPEISLNVKRFVPGFIGRGTSRYANPRTNFSASFNLQNRPDFTRRILNFSSGWVFNSPSGRQLYNLYLVDFNSVNVNLSNEFNEKLKTSISDLNLLNSYRTHLTPGGRATWITSNQSIRPFKSFVFFKFNFEWAGLIVAPLVNSVVKLPPADDGTKTLFNVTYAQFAKPDIDFSFHQRLNLHNTLVYRMATGIGIEGPNSSFLPFEKSFFGGGANSLRAWQARTLGPGSYNNVFNIEQTGDVKLESNVELRSSLIKILEGALFVDAGNIWTRHQDGQRPGSHFAWNNLLDELAVGAGAGLRLNFSFFILRVDGAVKIHDPALSLSDRWVYAKQKFQPKDVTLNLAIGYPF